MKLTKKHNVLLGFFIFTGLFATTPYGKKIVHSISILHQDTFTPYIKKNLEQASELEMQEFLQAVVKKAHLKYPMKKSNDELDIDLLYDINKLIYVKKINYHKLLNLKNINHDKYKITKALSADIANEACSQKLMRFLVINKNISVEYQYNNRNMELIDDIIVNKQTCMDWLKNNETYTFIDNVFKLFKH